MSGFRRSKSETDDDASWSEDSDKLSITKEALPEASLPSDISIDEEEDNATAFSSTHGKDSQLNSSKLKDQSHEPKNSEVTNYSITVSDEHKDVDTPDNIKKFSNDNLIKHNEVKRIPNKRFRSRALDKGKISPFSKTMNVRGKAGKRKLSKLNTSKKNKKDSTKTSDLGMINSLRKV